MTETNGEQAGTFVLRPVPTAPQQDHETTRACQRLQPSTSQPGHCCQQDAIHTDAHTHTLIHIPPPNTHTHIERGRYLPPTHTQCLVSLFVPVTRLFTIPHNTTHTYIHGWSRVWVTNRREMSFSSDITSSFSLSFSFNECYAFICPFSNKNNWHVEQLCDQLLQSRPRASSNLQYAPFFHSLTFSNAMYSICVLPAPTLYPYPSLIHASLQHLHINHCVLRLQPGPPARQQTTDGAEYWMEWRCCVMEASRTRLDQVRFALRDPVRQTFHVSDCWWCRFYRLILVYYNFIFMFGLHVIAEIW